MMKRKHARKKIGRHWRHAPNPLSLKTPGGGGGAEGGGSAYKDRARPPPHPPGSEPQCSPVGNSAGGGGGGVTPDSGELTEAAGGPFGPLTPFNTGPSQELRSSLGGGRGERGRWGYHVAFGVLFSSAAGGAHWPIAIHCPPLSLHRRWCPSACPLPLPPWPLPCPFLALGLPLHRWWCPLGKRGGGA